MSKEQKHSVEEVRIAANAIRAVKNIDDTIEGLTSQIDRGANTLGDKVRTEVGRNLLSQFTDDYIGEVVITALINALLKRRQNLVQESEHFVEFPISDVQMQNTPEEPEG